MSDYVESSDILKRNNSRAERVYYEGQERRLVIDGFKLSFEETKKAL